MSTDFDIDEPWLRRVLAAASQVAAEHPERVAVLGTDGVRHYKRTAIKLGITGNVLLHEWLASDTGNMHDHPWDCTSIILAGGYWEVTPEGRFWRSPGEIVFRKAEEPHRIEIDPAKPLAVSLFITGPWRRIHGHHTPGGGWVPDERSAAMRGAA